MGLMGYNFVININGGLLVVQPTRLAIMQWDSTWIP